MPRMGDGGSRGTAVAHGETAQSRWAAPLARRARPAAGQAARSGQALGAGQGADAGQGPQADHVALGTSLPDAAAPGEEPSGGEEPPGADLALVRFAQRDPRAFAPLYGRYLDPVYRYCLRRLGDREAAEDATGQVFARALAALPRYRADGPGSFRAWLFAIAHNAVVDDRRVAAGRPQSPLAEADAVMARDPGPEEAALAADAGHRLRRLLHALPPDQRRIVELRLAGLTGPEIAVALGKRHGAVKVAQHRAFRRLRDLLDAEDGGSTPSSPTRGSSPTQDRDVSATPGGHQRHAADPRDPDAHR